MKKVFDVIIIGAGVIGCSVASRLSAYKCGIAVLERTHDLSCGASKANSGIVHGGFDAAEGSLKAKFNVLGCAMMEEEAGRLDFPYRRNGSMVLAFGKEEEETLQKLYRRGIKNGAKGLSIISGGEVRALEPNVSPAVTAALYCTSSGITSPYEMTVAYGENAAQNGAEFYFDSAVAKITREGKNFLLTTSSGEKYIARAVVNCAGVHADDVCRAYEGEGEKISFTITPRRGEYILLDKTEGGKVNATLFHTPTAMGKGILVTPTVHGNLLLGPTADDIGDKEDADTTSSGGERVLAGAKKSVPSILTKTAITRFSGVRAHPSSEDFIIGRAFEGWYNLAGIESPGLTCAPALGKYMAQMIAADYNFEEDKDYIAERKGIRAFAAMSYEERERAIAENPLYGKIVCRCEQVTEAEIVQSIRRPLGARDMDGVKRRTRAGMGRCQSGFCMPRVAEIIARELNIDINEVTKFGGASYMTEGYIDE